MLLNVFITRSFGMESVLKIHFCSYLKFIFFFFVELPSPYFDRFINMPDAA